jgi:ABC-type Fe3+ transport system permease subunit
MNNKKDGTNFWKDIIVLTVSICTTIITLLQSISSRCSKRYMSIKELYISIRKDRIKRQKAAKIINIICWIMIAFFGILPYIVLYNTRSMRSPPTTYTRPHLSDSDQCNDDENMLLKHEVYKRILPIPLSRGEHYLLP